MNKILTSKFMFDTLWGVVRHLLTTFGGAMIADGIMTNDQMNGLIGSGFFIFGLAWSAWQKHQSNKTKETK